MRLQYLFKIRQHANTFFCIFLQPLHLNRISIFEYLRIQTELILDKIFLCPVLVQRESGALRQQEYLIAHLGVSNINPEVKVTLDYFSVMHCGPYETLCINVAKNCTFKTLSNFQVRVSKL